MANGSTRLAHADAKRENSVGSSYKNRGALMVLYNTCSYVHTHNVYCYTSFFNRPIIASFSRTYSSSLNKP